MEIKSADMINVDENFDGAIKKAEKLYLEGTVFIYPTDTIYGFGANPFNEETVTRINEIKGREAGKTFILLIDSMENLLKYVEIHSEKHIDFLISIWPNPVSVVLNLNEKASQLLGHVTAAFRIPNHRFCLKLLSKLKMPLISTSVNRSNQAPIAEYSVIKDEFSSEVDAIFYTEKKSFFEASTLIDLSEKKPKLLREGKIKFGDLLKKFK
ncbi:MAG: L-threonylcarbamoyladenylate synthase [Ignavibacteriaceae bacterium]